MYKQHLYKQQYSNFGQIQGTSTQVLDDKEQNVGFMGQMMFIF